MTSKYSHLIGSAPPTRQNDILVGNLSYQRTQGTADAAHIIARHAAASMAFAASLVVRISLFLIERVDLRSCTWWPKSLGRRQARREAHGKVYHPGLHLMRMWTHNCRTSLSTSLTGTQGRCRKDQNDSAMRVAQLRSLDDLESSFSTA
jgi:hypothetical protein